MPTIDEIRVALKDPNKVVRLKSIPTLKVKYLGRLFEITEAYVIGLEDPSGRIVYAPRWPEELEIVDAPKIIYRLKGAPLHVGTVISSETWEGLETLHCNFCGKNHSRYPNEIERTTQP